MKVFNVMRTSTARLMRSREFLRLTPCGTDEVAHYFLVGFGPLAQSLAVQLALAGHYPNCKRPRFTMFDREIDKFGREFVAHYNRFTVWNDSQLGVESFDPEYDAWERNWDKLPHSLRSQRTATKRPVDYVAVARFLNLPANTGDEQLAAQIAAAAGEANVKPIVFICGEDELQNVNSAARLKESLDRLKCEGLNYFVWLPRRLPLEDIFQGDPRIHIFGRYEQSLSHDELDESRREYFAQLLHKAYENSRKRIAEAKGEKYQAQDWNDLADFKRESNLLAADYLPVRLWAIGYELGYEPATAVGQEGLELPHVLSDTMYRLARMEHHRWLAERLLSGWRFDPERKDALKRTPLLIAYDDLPDDYKTIDLDLTRAALREAQKYGYRLLKTVEHPCLPIK